HLVCLFFSLLSPPPPPTLFPYTTLFRSLAGLPVRVDTVVDTDRPERRLPPDAAADAFLQIRQIELRPEPVDVADVEESGEPQAEDRKSTRLNSSHLVISYAVFCLKKKKT